jgi:hypothetical protein
MNPIDVKAQQARSSQPATLVQIVMSALPRCCLGTHLDLRKAVANGVTVANLFEVGDAKAMGHPH